LIEIATSNVNPVPVPCGGCVRDEISAMDCPAPRVGRYERQWIAVRGWRSNVGTGYRIGLVTRMEISSPAE